MSISFIYYLSHCLNWKEHKIQNTYYNFSCASFHFDSPFSILGNGIWELPFVYDILKNEHSSMVKDHVTLSAFEELSTLHTFEYVCNNRVHCHQCGEEKSRKIVILNVPVFSKKISLFFQISQRNLKRFFIYFFCWFFYFQTYDVPYKQLCTWTDK